MNRILRILAGHPFGLPKVDAPPVAAEPTYEGRTLAEWERLRDKAIRLNDLFCELLCNAHIRLMRAGRSDANGKEG